MRFGNPLIKKIDYGSSYGGTALKSLQNENLPDLDLLVREAVQNSSDAGLSTGGSSVCISFNYGTFSSRSFAATLPSVGPYLAARATGEDHFLEIRDTKTQGLTGTYRKEELGQDDHGNYFKLIFDMGKKQEQKEAGGSWGFGKSVYYRVSKYGLVIFYSQITTDEGMEQRLVASVVEDETKSSSSILQQVEKRATGRAWWGSPDAPEGEIIPITDGDEIASFLSLFGLEPFKAKQTGTSIIIPFADEERLLAEVEPPAAEVPEDIIRKCVWTQTVPRYIRHACMKWYAPRVQNRLLQDLDDAPKLLLIKVNGDVIRADDMLPFFRLVQYLYTAALFKKSGKTLPPSEESWKSRVVVEPIDLRKEGLERTTAGWVAFVRLSRFELNSRHAGVDPYILTRHYVNKEDVNEPIVMFARQPGMIINYAMDEIWTKGVTAPKRTGTSEEEYIFGFFVPDVDNQFLPGKDGKKMEEHADLGDYLRSYEGSDHVDWRDKSPRQLVNKIKKNTAKKLADALEEDLGLAGGIGGAGSRFSNYIGQVMNLVPGAKATGKSRSGGSGGGSGSKKSPFSLGDMVLEPSGLLCVEYHLELGDSPKRTLRLEVLTEKTAIGAKKWETEIGTSFPVQFVQATSQLQLTTGDVLECACEKDRPAVEAGHIGMKLCSEGTTPSGPYSALELSCDVPGQSFDGKVWLATEDRSIEYVVKAV